MSDIGDSIKRFQEIGKGMQELLKSLPKIEKIEIPKFASPLESITEAYKINESVFDELQRARQEEYEREEKYKQEVLRTLKAIEQNTGNIVEIVGLIRENNDKQDQIIGLLSEILSVGASKTKEEAESKFREVMKRIQEFGGTVESIQKLMGVLMTVYNSVEKML